MLKRLTVAVAALFALAAQALAAGTIPYSLSQQLDELGNPLAGCKLYLIQAGTVSTPQNGYSDLGLTHALANPLICDAAGRLPQFFVADGSIKVRLTKSNNTNVVTADNVIVYSVSSSGGGGSTVDATTILATGDVKVRYGTGVLSGFVRLNGRTIGSATSGATERANGDAQSLFEFLWDADANLAVSGGRGVSGNADWTANKTIDLPDMRGRGITALDDMGAGAAGVLTATTCTFPTTLGAHCGTQTKTISQANLPALTWPKTLAVGNTLGVSDTRTWATTDTLWGAGASGARAAGAEFSVTAATRAVTTTGGALGLTGTVTLSGDTTSGGSGTALSSLAPIMLITTYIKL